MGKPIALVGRLEGNTIVVDGDVHELDGRRVRVLLEVLPDDEVALAPEEQRRLWSSWVAKGPQGPIEGEAPDFP